MNLITAILIFALNGGIVDSPTTNVDTVAYMIPEIGIKFDQGFLTAQYYTEIDIYQINEGNYADGFNNGELRINLYADIDYADFGVTYTYDMTTAEDSICIHFRIQSYK